MKLTIDWLEKKSDDWIIVHTTNENGVVTENVSINRKNQKGEVFPGFDDIAPGSTIEGEPWTSSTGKHYIFAPKPQTNKKPNMDRIIEKKQQGIAESQARKEQSIAQAQDRTAWMWAKNNAAMLVAHHDVYKNNNDIIGTIESLATEIYNMEPQRPF